MSLLIRVCWIRIDLQLKRIDSASTMPKQLPEVLLPKPLKMPHMQVGLLPLTLDTDMPPLLFKLQDLHYRQPLHMQHMLFRHVQNSLIRLRFMHLELSQLHPGRAHLPMPSLPRLLLPGLPEQVPATMPTELPPVP